MKKSAFVKSFLCIVLCLILLCGCGGVTPENKSEPKTTETNHENISVKPEDVTGNFDDAFFKFTEKTQNGNFIISPLSFRFAMGMLISGAEGDTKEGLLNACGIADEKEWNEEFSEFIDFAEWFGSRDFRGADAGLKIANSVWKRNDIKEDFKDDYKKVLKENYDAEYKEFTRDNAVGLINDWADEKTEHLIPELLPKGYDAENLAVVLMNALYLKDSWMTPFKEEDTQKGEFTTGKGEKTEKDYMNVKDSFNYYEDDDVQIVVLPLAGRINMAFVLGNNDNITEKLSKCKSESVTIKIPKFEIETSLNNNELPAFLNARGAGVAFSDEADFSEMIDHQINISDIIQKAKISIDEKGVEAAAVTAIMMKDGIHRINKEYEFIADKPFSFYVYTNYENADYMMFAGKVVE